MSEPERIAKRLARAGLCSRRDAERWIDLEWGDSVTGKFRTVLYIQVNNEMGLLGRVGRGPGRGGHGHRKGQADQHLAHRFVSAKRPRAAIARGH